MSARATAATGLALALLAVGAGCARTVATVDFPQWPPAPAPAVVRYAGGFPDARAWDRNRTAWQRFFDFLFGGDDASREGSARSALVRPFGLAAHGARLWVADPDGSQVLEVNPADGSFQDVRCSFPWVTPLAVATGPDDALFVADTGLAQVVRVGRTSGTCSVVALNLMRPTGLAVSQGRLYVVDTLAHQVAVFDLAAQREVARFGGRGEGPGELNFPTSVAARGDGAVLVVDALNARVVAFAADGSVLSTFGRSGTEPGDFARPKGIALHRDGRVFVSDAQYGVVLLFDPDGTWRLAVAGSGREPTHLSLPAGLAVDGDMLFVADAYHHRVEFYRILEATP